MFLDLVRTYDFSFYCWHLVQVYAFMLFHFLFRRGGENGGKILMEYFEHKVCCFLVGLHLYNDIYLILSFVCFRVNTNLNQFLDLARTHDFSFYCWHLLVQVSIFMLLAH